MLSRAVPVSDGGDEEEGPEADGLALKGDTDDKERWVSRRSSGREIDFYDRRSRGLIDRRRGVATGEKKSWADRVSTEDEGPMVNRSCAAVRSRDEGGTVKGIRVIGQNSGIPPSSPPFSRAGAGSTYGFHRGLSSRCTTLFVFNIPPLLSASKLRVWFENFGSIVDVFIPRRRSRIGGCCFAFVRFNLEAEAKLACKKVDGSVLNGFTLEVNISRYPRAYLQTRTDVCGGKGVELGPVDSCAGANCWKGSVHTDCSGAMAVGASELAYSKVVHGLSFAQVTKTGGISKESKQGALGAKEGGVELCRRRPDFAENGEHMQAVVFNRCWLVDVPDRRFSDLDLLVDVPSIKFVGSNPSQREKSLFLVEAEHGNGDADPGVEELGLGVTSASTVLSGSLSELRDVDESGSSSACVVSGGSKEEEDDISEVGRASERLSCELSGSKRVQPESVSP